MVEDLKDIRKKMVDKKIRKKEVNDMEVIDEFMKVKREELVKERSKDMEYIDEDKIMEREGKEKSYIMEN